MCIHKVHGNFHVLFSDVGMRYMLISMYFYFVCAQGTQTFKWYFFNRENFCKHLS